MRHRLLALCVVALSCSPKPASGPPPEHPKHEPHPQGAHAQAAHPHAHGPHEHWETHPTADHRFTDAERWSKVFDDPARDAWQKPRELVAELSLESGAVVVDLGAGTGYLVPHLARAVPRGRVVAVDVEPEMVEWIERRAQQQGLSNVVARLGTPDDPKLEGAADAVLVVDTYHHIGDRIGYFTRLREKLVPRGRVVIVDFRMGKRPVGPPESHKLPPAQVEREMTAAGYKVCRRWEGLPHQYVIFFGVVC